MIKPSPPERRLRQAVSSLLSAHRFFGVLALRMPFVADPTIKTIAGDGSEFRYSPEWVSDLHTTHDQIAGSIAHIVFACALKHHTRRGERDYGKWQRASRIATAELLEREEIWTPGFLSGQDLPVEVIYERLDDPDDDDESQQPSGGGGSGGAAGDSPPPPSPQNQPQGGGSGQNTPQAPVEGAGEPNPSQSPDTPGEVLDAPQEQRDEQERQWDRAGKQAIQIAKAQGQDPGRIEQEFDGQHDHRRDWRDLLREYMRAVAPSDYSWSRPNRRFIDSGLYLPSLAGEGMGPIIVAIDTSGSVDDEHVNRACAEIFEIAEDVQPERVHVIQCDTRVTDYMDFDPHAAPDTITIRGRGGTAFQPVFDRVEELGVAPNILIYLTDLMGPAPEDPGYAVIWGVENEEQLARVPFGQGIVVPEEA